MDDNYQNFKIETTYNSIQLVSHQGRLELRGRDKSLQSVINLEKPHQLELKNLEYLLSVLLFQDTPQRILMLGTAAGSLLHFLRYHYPQTDITAIDIDSALIKQLLDLDILPGEDDKLTYIIEDAADFIKHCDKSFDLVIVDVFNGAQSPSWLLEQNSIQQLHSLLNDRGAVTFNLLVDSDHDFGLFYAALRRQFKQQVLCLPVSGLENKIVYAIRGAITTNDMPTNIQTAMELSTRLEIDFMPILSVIYSTNPSGDGLI